MSARVVVVGGGGNVEHEVSLASAAGVAEALERRGHTVDRLTIGRDGLWHRGVPGDPEHASDDPACDPAPDTRSRREARAAGLADALAVIGRADVLFPAVHGPLGEDGALAALCALVGVRVVGSGIAAGSAGMDKHRSKLIARQAGVRTAPGRVVTTRDLDDIACEEAVVVKPVSSGSSHGVSLARDEAELVAAVALACEIDAGVGVGAGADRGRGRALVEPVIRGREIDVAVLGEADGTRWAAPPLEIHAAGLFDTAAKYDGSARFTVPAEIRPDQAAALERAALAVFDAFGCRGLARVDFFLTEEGPVFNEINTMPGLTPASQAPRMFAAAGVGYDELVQRLVRGALRP
ncbi:D-alanine-D-alanine ligase [Microbacterium resistens]|uniref:D-alanine--D-alanine ligase n=1 Tax=Microbacterium resistens TaxID=156977 RepID=A0ABU1SCG9_9MICO|nr:ATP-grasp domain-containing protein [Microbacterium resistens]MDR6866928.1 D-alanine-D-alanine ligase [Microbacterium resistens]